MANEPRNICGFCTSSPAIEAATKQLSDSQRICCRQIVSAGTPDSSPIASAVRELLVSAYTTGSNTAGPRNATMDAGACVSGSTPERRKNTSDATQTDTTGSNALNNNRCTFLP